MSSWFGSWSGSPITTQAKLPQGSQASVASAAPGDDGFKPGEVVEYHSTSQGKWIPAKVLTVNPQGTYDLDCKPDVSPEKIRRRAQQPLGSGGSGSMYKIGDIVEYFGATQSRWVSAKVLKINDSGTYDLDCKPDVLPEKIRRPASLASAGTLYVPGEVVEYFSISQGGWIPAKVLRATSNGTYDLDCKPDVQLDKIRRAGQGTTRSLASVSEAGGKTYQAGDIVEYFGATLGKWIPAKVLTGNPNGTYDLDCKPGVQPEKIRRPPTLPPDAGAGPASGSSYKAGELVSYFSTSHNKWIPAKVVSVTSRGTYDLDCKPDVSPEKIRPVDQPLGTGTFGVGPLKPADAGSAPHAFAAGDLVEYLGSTQNRYIPAKVLKVNPDGTYDLDCKPGVLPERVRPRGSPGQSPPGTDAGASSGYAVGDFVEYFGATQQRWIPAKVISVNTDGSYGLDCKPDVPASRIRRPGSAPGSAGTVLGTGDLDQSNPLRRVSFGGDTRQGLFSPGPPGTGEVATHSGEPVQLLRTQRSGNGWRFEVCPEGASMLERNGRRRLAVASMCGLNATGKTFLVNLLLGRVQKGLPALRVGTGSGAGNDGLWLWGPVDPADDKSPLLAFFDCEGFGHADGDRARESHWMTLCALLSSVVLLNSRGDLNEELFRSLARVGRFVDNIEERGNEAHRPVLFWVLRDFVQDLKDSRGNILTPDEYLDQALHHNEQSEHDATREVRQSLLKFFRHRSCSTLPPPTSDPQLRQVNTMQYASLSGVFRSGVEELRQQVFAACSANPKTVGGQPLGCFAFVQLLRQLVVALNDDRILNVRGAWETVQHTVCGQLADELRETATTMLRALASGRQVPGGAQLPLTDEALYAVLRDQRHALKSKWEEHAVGSEAVRKEYWQELKETLAREESLVRVQNARLADQKVMEVLRAWQDWLDDDDNSNAIASEQISGQLGGAMDKLPTTSLSRAGRVALLAATRRVAAAHSTVAATAAQHELLQKRAVELGEQAAQQEGATRTELEATQAQLTETQREVHEAGQALASVREESSAQAAELEDAKARLREVLADVEAAHVREHDLKAHHRVTAEKQNAARSELEQCQVDIARLDAERLASERCARTAAQAAALEKERLEAELKDAQAEVEQYRQKIEQELAALKGENEKTRTEHQQRVEDVRKQLEEERRVLEGEQEKTRTEHMRMVEDAQRQLEEERKAHTGTLDEHKGRLMEIGRGAGILEGKVQSLGSENDALRKQLQELEAQVREAEVKLTRQSEENDQQRAELAQIRGETEKEEAEVPTKLREQAEELERWLEDEVEKDERTSKPRCGCSIQ
uniref:Guanylate-binding protein N-terminal domain-containing protein n=1 Tax=Alexandrium monilatum TaxID=311494 RepID=A0A7S4VAK9_9DINO